MKIVLVLVLLLALTLPTFAQDAQTPPPLAKTFCKGQIEFNYPLGWAIDSEYAKGAEGAEFIYAANDSSELANGINSPDPAHGNVVILVEAMQADFILHSYHESASSPEAVLSSMLHTPSFYDSPQLYTIQSFALNGHPAASVKASYKNTEGSVIVVQYSDDLFGVLSFVTPLGETLRWEATARSIFETVSITKSASCALPLDQIFTSDDGSFSFRYPADWIVKTDMPRLSLSIGNVAKHLPPDQIQAGDIDGAIFPDETYDEICARFGMCSWIGLTDATPDTVLDGMSTFFEGLTGTTLSREKLADRDTLIIYSTWDKVDQIDYIVRTGDLFTMMFFTGKPSTVTDNRLIFQAFVSSIQYKAIH